MGDLMMQWAFVLLLVFFLLYFSPLFFSYSTQEISHRHIPDLGISPQKSILIPLVLTYIGIYILAFTVTRDITTNFSLHIYILLLIFVIFAWYILAFDWEKLFFRDALRFHLICSYITIFAQIWYFFMISRDITLIHLIFSTVTMGFSYFFFVYFRDEATNIVLTCLIAGVFTLSLYILFWFPEIHIFTLLGCIALISMWVFEYLPRSPLFENYIESSRIVLLSSIIAVSIVLLFSPIIGYFHFIYFILIFSLFFVSIHLRYSNYIVYSLAIFILLYVYSYLFLPLLMYPDLVSSLWFIFSASLILIGSTYFWEERYPYDFSLLHYASIVFSVATLLYSLFFVAWGWGMSIFLACSLFFLAVLFLFSYFRFQYR